MKLEDFFKNNPKAAIAFSGGVDSAYLLYAAKTFGAEVSKELRIQYGGSMKPGNAKELMAERHIDGGLIGGAALKATDFAAIVNYKD